MIPGKDFKFRDDLKYDTVPIEMLLSPYNDVIIRYQSISVKEIEEENRAVLQYSYDIISNGKFSKKELRKDSVFNEYLGLILNYMILEATEAEENAIREDYSEEPVEE